MNKDSSNKREIILEAVFRSGNRELYEKICKEDFNRLLDLRPILNAKEFISIYAFIDAYIDGFHEYLEEQRRCILCLDPCDDIKPVSIDDFDKCD